MNPLADFTITSDRRNELLKRREITFTLGYAGSTPSRSEVMGKVCAILTLDEKKVVLDSVRTRFGQRRITGIARVYDDEDGRKRTEAPYLVERGKPKAAGEAAAPEAPKEAAKPAPKEPVAETAKEPAKAEPAKAPAKEART